METKPTQDELPATLIEAVRHFSDIDTCNELMARIKWPEGKISCPHCDSERVGKIETRKMLRCKDCRKQFSYKVGTIFEDSPLGLDKWFVAVWCIANAKNGISSCELARALRGDSEERLVHAPPRSARDANRLVPQAPRRRSRERRDIYRRRDPEHAQEQAGRNAQGSRDRRQGRRAGVVAADGRRGSELCPIEDRAEPRVAGSTTRSSRTSKGERSFTRTSCRPTKA